MATMPVGNSVPRRGFPGPKTCRRSFPSAAGKSVVLNNNYNVRMVTRMGAGGKAVHLESQLVPSRGPLQLPCGHSFGLQFNCGRIEWRRGAGARSGLVSEEPVIDGEGSTQGFQKWVIAAEQRFNVMATKINNLTRNCGLEMSGFLAKPASMSKGSRVHGLEAVVKVLETLYSKRLYARFYVLETIARVPYFAFVSVLHMYESFGWWRRSDYLKIHFAESWNELHHLLVMEALGGDDLWVDRFVAQHIAVAYYFLTSLMYLVSPRMAYHFSECVEMHAFSTYDKFIKSYGEELKKLPAPDVAVQYYTKGDLYMFDEFQTDALPHTRRPKIENLYDVFVNIREDEAQHCKTMHACQTGSCLRSPHQDVPLTELALEENHELVADCEGIFECATMARPFGNQTRTREGELTAGKSDGGIQ